MLTRKYFKIISFSLAATLFGGAFCYARSQNKDINAAAIFDFSSGDEYSTLSGSEVLSRITNENISEVEKDYVNTLDFDLRYETNKNNGQYHLVKNGDEHFIYLEPYSFIDQNKRQWEWKPSRLMYGNNEVAFEKDGKYYFAPINNLSSDIQIDYSLDLLLSKDDVNTLINVSYLKGQEYSEQRKQIEESNKLLKEQYESDLQAYEDYLINQALYNEYLLKDAEYAIKKEAYDDYCLKKTQYDSDLVLYRQYLSALDEYNAKLKAYNQYLSDLEYYLAHYRENQKAYEEYYPKLAKYNYRLKAMDIIYQQMNSFNSLYGYVMGDTVTNVLARKDDLGLLGVGPDIVDEAYVATINLRRIFTDYKNCQGNVEKYNYYYYMYSEIKTNLENLLRTLDKLFRTGQVKSIAEKQGKKEKYLALVSELAYVCLNIDDKTIYNYEAWNGKSGNMSRSGAKIINENWLVCGENKTYRQILNGITFLEKEYTGYPEAPDYPADVIELLPEPTEVPHPGEKPSAVKKPIEPKAVEEPVKPEIVNKPLNVKQPIEPTYLVFDSNKTALANAFDNGELILRNEFHDDVSITLFDSYSGQLTDNVENVIHFYSNENSLLSTQVFKNGVTYNGTIPFKEGDDFYNDYSFTGWTNLSNEDVDLSTLNESLNVYPKFIGNNVVKHTITWVIDGHYINETYKVGDMPTPPENIYKEENDQHFYIFSCWDKDISLVYEDKTYTAIFNEKNYYYVSWVIDGVVNLEKYKEGELVSYKGNTPVKEDEGDSFYVFEGWDYNFDQPITKNIKISAMFYEGKYYCISFNVNGEISTQIIKENTMPVAPLVNSWHDECYFYSFANWDKTLSAANKNIEYTCVYTRTSILNKDNKVIPISIDDDTIIINASNLTSFNLSPLLDLMLDDYPVLQIEIIADGYEIFFSKSQVNYLVQHSADVIDLNKNWSNNVLKFELKITDKIGQKIDFSSSNITLKIYDDFDETHFMLYQENIEVFAAFSKGAVAVQITPNLTYRIETNYYINFVFNKDASVSADFSQAAPGEIITLNVETSIGYEIGSIYVIDSYGNTIDISNNKFVMPASDVSVAVSLHKITYKITFVVDGEIYATRTGTYGSQIKAPTDPYKIPDGDGYYVFFGWDKEIHSITGDETYTATFIKIPYVNPNDSPQNSLINPALVTGGIVCGSVIIFLLIFFIVRFNRKKKK